MYSVVLAAMLTAGTADVPSWGCFGCHGCCGGWSCHGCCGGCWGCHGCCGGCWGCYGCYGGCYSSCCCCGGCYGCYGCYGCCGGVVVQPVYAAPVAPAPAPAADKPKTGALPTQATVVVKLPADARLYVDGELASLTSDTRTFTTPQIQRDRDYFYTIRAETTRDGQTVARSERITVRAGLMSRVDFGDLMGAAIKSGPESAAPTPARITVQLPEDARLYVDDVAAPLTSATRSFETPNLEPGRAYTYTIKAEVVRNGQTRTDSRRVEFQAGKAVTVDFAGLGAVQAASR